MPRIHTFKPRYVFSATIAFFLFISIALTGCLEQEKAEEVAPESTTFSPKILKKSTSTISFSPSLGINTEAPQPESGESGESLMFVDLFRTARPFQELSVGITVDANGWPTSIAQGGVARTKLMETIPYGSIPYGEYIMLYEGSGQVGFGSGVTVQPLPSDLLNQGYQGRTVTISSATVNGININISGISEGEGNYIKNIRLIMPGGICGAIRNEWVADASSCSINNIFESFVEKLKFDRNEIVFNPYYLNFMKDFNTIRMMNLMAASPGRSSCSDGDSPGDLLESCILHPVVWEDRAQLSDAAWGGTGNTSLSTEPYVTNRVARNGVPVEVLVELANQLDINPWVNMPHAADNDYISRFAEYVKQNLDSDLKVYIEYSNEVWNVGFLGYHYAQIKGIENGFDTLPNGFPYSIYRDENYFARLRYYSKRSVEVFDLWQAKFGGNSRLVRVLSSFQGDTILSENILAFQGTAKNRKVDALAIAPYFSGCIVADFTCSEAPILLPDAQTVDDVFEAIDWESSPNGIAGILRLIEKHADIASANRIHLVAYEGGQNLVVTGAYPDLEDPEEDAVEKQRLRDLFAQANRDPRMKQRYLELFNGWQGLSAKGTALFTLYTQPQSYYRYGSWGIKEHLNQARADAPKYDAALTFQETVLEPWWDYDRYIKQALIVIINYLLLED